MFWKYATKKLSFSLKVVAHSSAAFFLAEGWFGKSWETIALAAASWVVIRGLAFFLDACTGP